MGYGAETGRLVLGQTQQTHVSSPPSLSHLTSSTGILGLYSMNTTYFFDSRQTRPQLPLPSTPAPYHTFLNPAYLLPPLTGQAFGCASLLALAVLGVHMLQSPPSTTFPKVRNYASLQTGLKNVVVLPSSERK